MQSVASWAAIWPPLTLATLAAIARRHGAQVDLIDCNVEPEADQAMVAARVERFNPDITVVNTSFPSIEGDAACAAAIKAACPGTLVTGVGQFFTLLGPRALEDYPVFDVAITGEPEATFTELLEHGGAAAGLAGALCRENGAVRAGPERALIQDLDEIPLPARDLLHNARYRLPTNGRPFTLVNAARGCPYECTFCIAAAYHGRRIRRHSTDYVLDELDWCRRELGLRDFLFWEEAFTIEREPAAALCEALAERGWDISWASTTRADYVEPDMLALMKRSGCFLLGLGIESGNQAILDGARKRERVEDMRRAAALCKTAGIKTMGHFIFGLPGETPATVRETIRFALDLDLDYIQCYAAVPYPGTALGELAREKGWLRSERWADYDFGGRSILDIGTISPEEVDQARETLFRRFYFRPTYLGRQALEMLAHPGQFLQAAKFLDWIRQR
mgnify:CR=1 FL=1